MAFEDRTFKNIVNEALDNVPNKFSKREGDIIYDAIAPTSLIAEGLYAALAYMIEQPFPDTADRTYLTRWASVFGQEPYEATPAVIKVKFTADAGTVIPVDFRLNFKEVFYRVEEPDSDYEEELTDKESVWLCRCESPGIVGNYSTGIILPVDHLPGLRKAEIVGIAIRGEDVEDTETFRARFLASFVDEYFGGNRADYVRFTDALPGVGAVKVDRCPRGVGTVDVYILDSEYNPATPELIEEVQEALEPKVDTWPELHNCGLGIAPIGHEVDVKSGVAREIEVGLRLTFDSQHDWDKVILEVKEHIEGYFTQLRSTWANEPELTIQAWGIVQAISDIEGIVDVSLTSTTMNGQTENITIGRFEIPVLSAVVEAEEPEEPDTPCPNCPDCDRDGDCKNCPRILALFKG